MPTSAQHWRYTQEHVLCSRWMLAVLVLILTGCTTVSLRPELPQAHLLKHVPFIAQDAHACGPASLAMVLHYYGHANTQEQLKPLLVLPEREGTLQIEIAAAARREGLLSLQGPATLDTLLADVAAGFPVIVLQNLRFGFWPQWHYAVVVGFDQQGSVVLLRSGDHDLIEVPYQTFMNTWKRANHWALVISPPNRLPPSATVKSVARAAADLQQSGHPTEAMAAYSAAANRWPRDLALWNALGNLAYEQKRWILSTKAYSQSLMRLPTQPRLWNNFAYALQQAGCTGHATQALSCALSMAPEDAYLQSSRKELDQIKPASLGQCDLEIVKCRITDQSLPLLRLQ